ncbi:MAG: hypothetical protein WCE62_11055 [Polyangiales bacterium]
MAVNSRLVPVSPHESKSVIADRLDIGQLEVAALREPDGALVTLALRARAEATQELVRVGASVPISPVDFHHAGTTRRA